MRITRSCARGRAHRQSKVIRYVSHCVCECASSNSGKSNFTVGITLFYMPFAVAVAVAVAGCAWRMRALYCVIRYAISRIHALGPHKNATSKCQTTSEQQDHKTAWPLPLRRSRWNTERHVDNYMYATSSSSSSTRYTRRLTRTGSSLLFRVRLYHYDYALTGCVQHAAAG